MTTTDKSRADALTDLSDDELALIREEAARITDDWCERQFMEPSQKESDAKFVREVLRLAASPSSQPAAAPADLQGLRRSILTSREIVRDQDGMLSHPAVPYLDEDVNYETFFAAFGIEATFIHMEDDVDCDTYDRYFASNSPDCCTWTPSSPQGDGWMLLEIYDTEDGPVALYVREKKPESMRERWKREKRESDAAAPSPADERMEFVERVMGMFEAWPNGKPGPTDEPESHYRFGYNTALEDVLTALDVGSPTRRAASANETGAEGAKAVGSPNRPSDSPGGMECSKCGCIFIGGPEHDVCAVCAMTSNQSSELESMTRMFHAACHDLSLINEALGLDPDDGGAEPILDAIAELRAQIASAQTEEPVAWAVYNGWSRICFYMTEDAARDHAQKAQKNHDLSGSLAAFRVVPLYAAPQPAQADALGEEAYVAKRMTETLATVYATIIGDDEVDTDDGLNAIERVVRAAQVLRLEVDLYRAQADAPDDTHKFKNFHRRLCERFGYVHDEIDWRRDQVSLIEWIAKKADAPAEAREPIAWMTDDDRAITAAQKQRALADGGATASSVRPYSIPCYAVSAPADAGEARLTDAARDMLAERRRQVEAEGWTPEHDDQYQHGAIALAAACYAANAGGVAWADPLPSFWPWMHNWWKPTTPRRDLVKAGALILAELERLDRAALLNGADHDQ